MKPLGQEIIDQVSAQTGISRELIISDRRTAPVCSARLQIARHLHAAGYSAAAIGRILRKDHTTTLLVDDGLTVLLDDAGPPEDQALVSVVLLDRQRQLPRLLLMDFVHGARVVPALTLALSRARQASSFQKSFTP